MAARDARKRSGRVALWIVVALAWLLMAQAGATTWAASCALAAAREVQGTALGIGNLAAVEVDELAELDGALVRLRGALGHLRWTAWWAPCLARLDSMPYLQAVGVLFSDGLSAALDLSELAWWTLLEVESGAPGAWATLPDRSVSASTVRSLTYERQRLLSIDEGLGRVERALAGVGGESTAKLRDLITLGQLATDLGLVAPQLAGEMPRRVLVVFQNDDELRPTGGFISSVAELTLQDGEVTEMRFMDSYAVEAHQAVHPPAPPPLARWMDAGILLFRDANWSPDYCESAEVMAALYALDMGREVDAVVAVNASLAAELLKALGPVSLPDYDVVVTSENVREVAATFWAEPLDAPDIGTQGEAWSEWLAHRKDIGGALVEALLARLSHVDPQQLIALAMTLQDAVERKDLLVWSPDDVRLQQDLRHAGLEGGLREAGGDYLMVVEANVGWNKVNRQVARQVAYTVDLSARPRAELTIAYENRSAPVDACEHKTRYGETYEAMTEGCYWNYVRILVPKGAELQAAEGLASEVTVGRVAGKTVFGGLVLVPAGETVTVRWAYHLPDDVAQLDADAGFEYDLVAQRQPGMRDVSLTVTIRAPGMVTAPRSPWVMQPDGSWGRHLAWDRDIELSMALEP